jgi:hypothetical protein
MLSYFASEKITATLYRTNGGAYAVGIWQPAVPTTTSVQIIAPQPMRSDELQMFPEGERKYNHRKTWITSEIHVWPLVPEAATGENPDIFLIDGKYYKVMLRPNER